MELVNQEITLFACPLCDFSDEDYDAVLSHIWDAHEDEATDAMRPVEIGEVDEKAGKGYVELFKAEKEERKEGDHVCSYESEKIIETISSMQTEIRELRKENHFLHNELSRISETTAYLKKSLAEEAHQHGQTRQKIAKLEAYLTTKNNGRRRDFDLLAVDLKKEVLRRGRKGMGYSDIMFFCRFKSPQEAYRLMDHTTTMFGDEVRLHKSNSHKQCKKLVPFQK